MTLAIATFWKENQSSTTSVKRPYRYLIVEDETKTNIRIVSITALTSPCPMPSDEKLTFIVNNLTPQKAIDKAYKIICQHDQLQYLNSKISPKRN